MKYFGDFHSPFKWKESFWSLLQSQLRIYDPLPFLQTPRSQIGLKVNVFGWIRKCKSRSRLNKNQLYLPQQRDEALPEYPLFGHVL